MKKNAQKLYLRRGTYWFSQRVKGKRIWVNLQTSDEAEAVRRVRLVRVDSIVRPAMEFLPEGDAFVAYKRTAGSTIFCNVHAGSAWSTVLFNTSAGCLASQLA